MGIRDRKMRPWPNKRRRIEDTSSDIPALPADQEPRQDDLTDLEWIKQRMSKNVQVVETAFEQSDDERGPHITPVKDPKETILQISRWFVRNLSFSCIDQELADLFKPFGEISQMGVLSFLYSSWTFYFPSESSKKIQ